MTAQIGEIDTGTPRQFPGSREEEVEYNCWCFQDNGELGKNHDVSDLQAAV